MVAASAVALAMSPAAASDRVHLLRDIAPGEGSSMPAAAGVVNGVFLFFATDPEHGRELWRSDGTAAGTQLLRDIRPGPVGSVDFGGSAVAAGLLAFVASNGTSGAQLWRSDGTADGTVVVWDTHPGDASAEARLVTADGDRVWFIVESSFFDPVRRRGEDLWVSDLTAAGTKRVASVGYSDPDVSGDVAKVTSLTPFRDGVLLARRDEIEIFQSVSLRYVDLTAPEDDIVYQVFLQTNLRYLRPVRPTVAGDTAYLDVDEVYSNDDCSVLRIDGEAVPLATGPAACALIPLAGFGDDLLLAQPPLRLQRATPGDETLQLVSDLGEGRLPERSVAVTPQGVYFAASRADADELWRAESAVDPPVLLHRFPRSTGGYIRFVTADGNGAYIFVTDNFGNDPRIWRSDGPSTATRPIAVMPHETSATWFMGSGDTVFVAGSDLAHGDELWVIPQAAPCAGDCNASGVVEIDEVIRGVAIGLGLAPADECAAADANTDQILSVDELVAAVGHVLDGCGAGEPAR